MKPAGAAAAFLAALVLLPLATAAFGAGSALEADAPVQLQGRVDALVQKGVAGFVSDASKGMPIFSLRAASLEVRHVTIQPPCNAPPPTCALAPTPDDEENVRVFRDATVTLTRIHGPFKAIASNDAGAYDESNFQGAPGTLITTTSTGTTFTSRAKPLYLSPYDAGWSEEAPAGAATADVYTLDPKGGMVDAPGGGLVQGKGNLQVLLQGVSIRVSGTDENGNPGEATYETPFPTDSDEATAFLDLQATDAVLRAVSPGPLLAHGVSVVDATSGATLAKPKGELVEDGKRSAVDSASHTLRGPVSLTLTKVADGEPLRLAFTISSVLTVASGAPPEEDEPTNTAALVAAGAAGAGGMGLLAALAYFWPRLKFATTLLILPLYSRIERTAVLEHEKRDEIYGLIRSTPGIHAHEIGEKVQIGWGTTVYHLKLLEQHSLIVSQKSGRYKRFFVNTGEFTKKKDAYGALRNETAKAVAQYIVDHPGITQKELCAALGIQPSLASWHVEKLEGVELVKRVKDGRMVRYFAGPAWSQLNVHLNPRGGADGVAET